MAENKQETHDRLQKRTDELKADHENISRDRTPFDQADHDRHNKNLRQHKKDLAAHKIRSGSTPDPET
jgi:hypothetical protein